MMIAIAKVSRTDIIVSVAALRREISTRCIRTPMPKNNGTVTMSVNRGSKPVSRCIHQVRYAASTRKAAWAIITTRITPKYRVRPAASNA